MRKETRKERFAKYRQEIINTPDDKFPNSSSKLIVGSDLNSLSQANRPSFALSYGDALQNLTDIAYVSINKGSSPYRNYLNKKKRILALKLLLFVVAVVLMCVWYAILSKKG